MLKKLMSTTDSWGLLGLRLVTGAILLPTVCPSLVSWAVAGLEGTAAWLGGLGVPLPMLSAVLVASCRSVGGLPC